MSMTWTQDAQSWVSEGTLGKYRITRRADGRYVTHLSRKSGGTKRLGDAPSLSIAQQWSAEYDGYRANAKN